jgi:hypothetical protein
MDKSLTQIRAAYGLKLREVEQANGSDEVALDALRSHVTALTSTLGTIRRAVESV